MSGAGRPSGRNDMARLAALVADGYALPLAGTHGAGHWARVCENGLRVARATGADEEVVALFALFHDSRRQNEEVDRGHGLRGAELARSLLGSSLHLEASRFELLFEACRLHTRGLLQADPTLQACWDADRLDLLRVGIVPDPVRLSTDAARELLPWANERAARCHLDRAHLTAWGLAPLFVRFA